MDCSLPGFSFHEISQARIPSGLPFPPPGDLSDLGIEPSSLASSKRQADSLHLVPPGKPHPLPPHPHPDASDSLKNRDASFFESSPPAVEAQSLNTVLSGESQRCQY